MRVLIRQIVELDHEQCEQVFMDQLRLLCGGLHTYERDGKVYDWEDTGHGSGLTTEIKKPSKVMITALRLRSALLESKKRTA